MKQDEDAIDSDLSMHNLSATEHGYDTSYDQDLLLINPWANGEDGAAPEDEETDLLVNFGKALTFLGKSREEAVQEYLGLLGMHVSPEMKAKTSILDYLKEEEVVQVFVPTEWTGIQGIALLKVEWKDTLPPFMKPKARPINPRL